MRKGAGEALDAAFRRSTSPLRLLPDVLIIGAQRCGTSSLYEYLVAHPDVARAARKEVHFFDEHFDRGLSWYRGNFALSVERWRRRALGRPHLVLEASPYYLFHPWVPQRVAAALPAARLIVLLRNPVDRAVSHYHHEVRKKRETLPFEDAVAREPERLEQETARIMADPRYRSFNHRRYSYLARGIYVDQLLRWTAYFPLDQILVLRSEDLFDDPRRFVRDLLTWLGLPLYEGASYRALNQAPYPRMDPNLRRHLVDYFRPHNERLYGIIGRNMGWDESRA